MRTTSHERTAHCERATPQGGKLYMYIQSMLTAKVSIHINEVGQTTKQNIEEALIERVSNKCVEEGYIRPKTIQVHTYSSGGVRGEYIDFHVAYQCQVACPVEGQVLECTVKTITKAGIHAQCIDQDGNIPVTVFVARDHHTYNEEFQHVNEGDKIHACVIGTRYELNDPYICVIAKLVSAQYADKFQSSGKINAKKYGEGKTKRPTTVVQRGGDADDDEEDAVDEDAEDDTQ